ncbi:efflux RND transporter permease subunit [Stappia sp. F7233]|uniref:Efflux RND transporter permease subunit n=1 Tax=Stappia albiluteola TaxID=2758565 RepID=A0A839AI53_9HYPH|nr:CusA/CzcA family heavy metal efflux RND transporter [Stappia albiluteola]MBA5778189.1 efflux RND transporter permease subunit [Stappia albiluteola]
MIARLIRWSGENVVLVLIGATLATLVGLYAVTRIPLDAIPDLSDTQVIVYTEYPGQAPQVVEDQVTYPLTSALLSVPNSRVVRGFSFFGVSFVYVIFEDGTDIYWARSRVLEYLDAAQGRLPPGISPTLGPDATGVGWVYQYAIKADERNLDELRSIQDWQVRFGIAKAEGVAEIASVGGFVKQYAVVVDPLRMRAFGLTLGDLQKAIRASNLDVGGRTIELAEAEFMIRGRGYLKGIADIEEITLMAANGVPVRIADVARVELVPDQRRGVAELDGNGEVASGIAVQRYGANALDVIGSVKEKLAELKSSLPEGVEIETVYDRSQLIGRAIETLRKTLTEEMIAVAAISFLFLLHARSAIVAVVTLPIGVLIAISVMNFLGIGSNIMSLGGIAIAIGAMVDASIVMVENAHKRLEQTPEAQSRVETIIRAAEEVGPSLFFSLLAVVVSFLPIFVLEDQEGRLFKPLAYTKTFAMAAAAILSVTLIPALMVLLVRGRLPREDRNPLSRALIFLYRPVIRLVLKAKVLTVLLAVAVFGASFLPASRLGSEFMPTLNEGTLFYMPVTLPGLSVTKASELLQTQNRIIRSFPEVQSVFGKAGRAQTATDPAPMEMFETVINLKPEAEWRDGMTIDSLVAEMDEALQFPGISNAWTMPIKARIDMLATGIRTPVGVKIYGEDRELLEAIALDVERVVRKVPGATSAYAERVNGGYFLEIEPDRQRLARYGLSVEAVQETVSMAIGAKAVTETVEGRERYDVIIRYPRDIRSDPDAIASEVLVPLSNGASIPLGDVATIRRTQGPTSIRTEDGQQVVYVFVDIRGRDLGGFVAEARATVERELPLPPGYRIGWSGQFEYLERAKARFQIVVPATVLVIFLLLYLNFRRLSDTLIVMLSLPFALTGGLWLMDFMGFNMSVATTVGFIALAGVATSTGVVMLVYLNQALEEARNHALIEGRSLERGDLHQAVIAGAVDRVRPKMMTVATTMIGLVPILWSTGVGSEVMQRIAVPMIGGMVSSTLLTLVVIPALFALVRGWRIERRAQGTPQRAESAPSPA